MNSYITHDATGKSVLIDSLTANNEDFLLDGVKDLSKILLTHGHSDHIGSAFKVASRTGATVYASELERNHMMKGTGDIPPFSEIFLVNDTLSLLRPYIKSQQQAIYEGPVEVVHDGDVVAGSGIRVVSTPGHTDGSVTFIVTSTRDCFIGDLLRGGLLSGNYASWPFMFKSKPQILAGIQRIKKDCDVFYPGHGFPFNSTALDAFLKSL